MFRRTLALLVPLALAGQAPAAAPAAAAAAVPLARALFGKQGAQLLGKEGDQLLERSQKQWDAMMKANKDAKALIDLWATDGKSPLPGLLEHLGQAEKLLDELSATKQPDQFDAAKPEGFGKLMQELRET